MSLIVFELKTQIYQEYTTKQFPIQLQAIRPHILKYGNPAGALAVQIQDRNGQLIEESAAVLISDITLLAQGLGYTHGPFKFELSTMLRKNTTYRIALVGKSGYSFSEADYIAWINDYGWRIIQPSYQPSDGFSAPLHAEFWENRKVVRDI